MRFGNDILRQADALAAYTEDPPRLTRTYLTSQHRQAGNFLLGLMREAGMYAVVKTGGKQYRVVAGDKLKVEQIPADVGAEVILDQVLMVGEGESVRLGQPLLSGASVKATVVSHGRGEKVKIFKMRRRKHYQKHQGHRQGFTELKIDAIVG